MEELIKAILTRYNAADGATLKAATPGGLWHDQAPQDASGTYIVLIIVSPLSESFVMGTSGAATGETRLQFSILNTSRDSEALVVAAKKALRSLYHDVLLTLTDLRVISAKCNNEKGPMRDPDSEGYQFIIDCLYMLGR